MLTEYIVEIGLLDNGSGAVFNTVVRPPRMPGDDPTVHGISPEELRHGPDFAEAFRRMVQFLTSSVEMALAEATDSSGEELAAPALPEQPPGILIAAHNGFNFDVPLLLVECLRSAIGLELLENWLWVDTLHVLRAAEDPGACVKLQCSRTRHGVTEGEHAHRALDDCLALRGVCQALADRQGVSVARLLAPFCVALDKDATLLQLSCVL